MNDDERPTRIPVKKVLSYRQIREHRRIIGETESGKRAAIAEMLRSLPPHHFLMTGVDGPVQLVLPPDYPEASPSFKRKLFERFATPRTGITVGVFGESEPSRIQVVSNVAAVFAGQILRSVEDLNLLTPSQLEELVMDRLFAMGYEAQQTGKSFRPDGGIDIVFWSRPGKQFPIQGAIQVKHHKKFSTPTGVQVVREMAGVLAHQHRGAFNMGMVVTNTFFTQKAQAFVKAPELFLRLRDGKDILRWVRGNFESQDEFREFPSSIELTTDFILEMNRNRRK